MPSMMSIAQSVRFGSARLARASPRVALCAGIEINLPSISHLHPPTLPVRSAAQSWQAAGADLRESGRRPRPPPRGRERRAGRRRRTWPGRGRGCMTCPHVTRPHQPAAREVNGASGAGGVQLTQCACTRDAPPPGPHTGHSCTVALSTDRRQHLRRTVHHLRRGAGQHPHPRATVHQSEHTGGLRCETAAPAVLPLPSYPQRLASS